MINTNKIYIVEYNNKTSNINTPFVCYTLQEAINIGMSQFTDAFFDTHEREPIDNNELEKFIQENYRDLDFIIKVISGNRLRFRTTEELIYYFLNNIDNIDNENLYDFLLSMVESQELFFNYKGELEGVDFATQCPYEENGWNPKVYFTEELCKEGKYTFAYNDIGRDTLYHASWIREK